jgi:hypothetical protein
LLVIFHLHVQKSNYVIQNEDSLYVLEIDF